MTILRLRRGRGLGTDTARNGGMRRTRRDDVAAFEEADGELAATLDSLDDAPHYRDWIVSMLQPWTRGPILEVGAGHGTFTEQLATFGRVVACEPSPRAAALLEDRFADHPDITVECQVVGALDPVPTYATAVLINVLEHIEDDAALLIELRERLTPEGRLVLWVPAFPLLYSPFDRTIGHFRRYRRKPLVALVTANGFTVDTVHHANAPGFFSWLLVARLLRRPPTDPRAVKLFDRVAIPVIRRVESRIRPPFGQSIFLVATRKSNP